MTWKPTPVRTVPNPDPLGKPKFIKILPVGTMTKIFTMKVDEHFSKNLEDLCNMLEAEWSKAAVVRLALERLYNDVNGVPQPDIATLRKRDRT